MSRNDWEVFFRKLRVVCGCVILVLLVAVSFNLDPSEEPVFIAMRGIIIGTGILLGLSILFQWFLPKNDEDETP